MRLLLRLSIARHELSTDGGWCTGAKARWASLCDGCASPGRISDSTSDVMIEHRPEASVEGEKIKNGNSVRKSL